MANRENKPYPKHKRIALLTTELAAVPDSLYHITRANRVIANVIQ